ncbi:uncharacterized protein otoa [Nerophis ophidion]|uniref:uncharacterized protein otoa n=1 Tax=Nerophis ophidion TaxID=159077 RepID=UPI002AE00BE1|nr:uncharacterized protein otoa [Nerophis ophidion]
MAAMGAFSLLIASFVWMKCSNAQLEWMLSDTMQSDIEKAAFDPSTPETMCAIFRSPNFTSEAKKSEMKPSLAKKLLQKIKECYRGELELEDDVAQLGPLTCYYDNAPNLTPELSRRLLAQFSECKNPKATMLKMLLLRKALSNSNWTTYEVLHLLGSSVSLLSPTQLDSIASSDLKQVIKDLPPGVQWRMTQQRTLVKKLLGDEEVRLLVPATNEGESGGGDALNAAATGKAGDHGMATSVADEEEVHNTAASLAHKEEVAQPAAPMMRTASWEEPSTMMTTMKMAAPCESPPEMMSWVDPLLTRKMAVSCGVPPVMSEMAAPCESPPETMMSPWEETMVGMTAACAWQHRCGDGQKGARRRENDTFLAESQQDDRRNITVGSTGAFAGLAGPAGAGRKSSRGAAAGSWLGAGTAQSIAVEPGQKAQQATGKMVGEPEPAAEPVGGKVAVAAPVGEPGPVVKAEGEGPSLLCKNQEEDEQCQEVSSQQLLQLGQVIKGVPSCVLRRVKVLEMLKDVETLRSVSQRMRRAQRKAMLQGLLKKMSALELVGRLPGSLLRSLSVKTLQEAEITSSLQLKTESLNRPQAAFLAAKLFKSHKSHFWRTSIIQGVTCKMIDKMADTDLQDMAQAIEETPWWLSKAQIGCAAWKYFAALRKERADYFKNITEEQFIEIPTSLMIHMPAWELNQLPDSVCEVFLNKTQSAKLSSLPRSTSSRLALLNKALHCLTKDKNMSSLLTIEDVSRLGELVCELPASTLSLMDANTLNVSMQVIASCQHVPHREALMQLIKENFGNPSEWSQETMESLGPLWDWDEHALFALPFKPWMIEVFYFLRSQHRTQALRRTFFKFITSKRENEIMTDSLNSNKPTVDVIEELGMDNVFWSADQLDAMSSDMFLVTMETLGSVPDYDLEQLTVLSKKATEALGEASHMNESVVAQIGCIAQGFSNADLEKMAFSLDMLEETGRCGWKMWQLNSVWKSVSKRNNLSAEQLDASDMAALNVFMCGLSSDEISQLDVAAFRDAVGSINDIRCLPSVAQQFQKVLLSAFGRPDSWTEASVSEVGNMIAGLHAHQLASLDPSVMMFLSQSSVPLLHPNNIAALSVAQLEALGPDNAAMVTKGQRAGLTDVQMEALARAESGEMQSAASQMQSGAPSVNTEGISALIKPLLVLLVGFLLL